jgi:MSHA pilin protein MshD
MRHTVRHRGLTLVETVVAVLLVSLTFVAALHAVGASSRSQRLATDRSTALMLAEDLMGEIMAVHYGDPDGSVTIGRDGSESAVNRMDFDDVDDYDGWQASPPVHRDGTAMNVASGWSRRVRVQWVQQDSIDKSAAAESGVKRIDVEVRFNGRRIVLLNAFATDTIEQSEKAAPIKQLLDDLGISS